MELILLSAVFLALLWTAWRVGYWHGQRSLTRIDDHAKRRRLRLGLPDPTVEPDEPLKWPGWCSHGDTYDHEHSVLERSFGRKSEDGSLEEPSVVVFHLDAEEWAAARDNALAQLGCTWHDLADIERDGRWVSAEHRKAWLMFGGWTAYNRWAEENPVEDDTEDDADVEVTATPKGEYL